MASPGSLVAAKPSVAPAARSQLTTVVEATYAAPQGCIDTLPGVQLVLFSECKYRDRAITCSTPVEVCALLV